MAKRVAPKDGEVKEVKTRKRTKKVSDTTTVTPVKTEVVEKKVRKPRVKKEKVVEKPVTIETPVKEEPVVTLSIAPVVEDIKTEVKVDETPAQLKRHGLSKMFAKMFNRVANK